MAKCIIVIFLFYVLSVVGCNNNDNGSTRDSIKYDYKIDGYVPNEKTAINVAESILVPIYGKSVLDQRPFIAKLVGDTVWIIEGSLAAGYDGGVANVEIRKKDCSILKVTHGK